MTYKTLKDFTNLENQLVLVRVDFNVPTKDGKVLDNSRIKAHLDTINNLTSKGAKVVLISHLGRPKNNENEFSLLPVANELETLVNTSVSFCSSTEQKIIDAAKKSLKSGHILLLENIRFFAGETENNSILASFLSNDIYLYVNDAFASSHREHASVSAICKFVHNKAVGLLMEKEMANLNKIDQFKQQHKKIAVFASGAKVSTKLELLKNLTKIADKIFIGGAMANTFLASLGEEIGYSLFEENMLEQAAEIMHIAAENDCDLLLPGKFICAKSPKSNQGIELHLEDIDEDDLILDIAKQTIDSWVEELKEHDLIILNGPIGLFENKPFDKGTNYLFNQLAKLPAYKIAGGGDTIFAINKAGATSCFDFISTGGGALLEALEGKELPGIKALKL